MHCSRLEGRCGSAVKSCVLRCTCRHLWTGLRPYKDAVSKLLEQRKEATAKEPVKSQPAPLLDYDPAEDDALSTLMQVCCWVPAVLCLLCCACRAVLCLLCPGGSMSTLMQIWLSAVCLLHCNVGLVSGHARTCHVCLGHERQLQQRQLQQRQLQEAAAC